MFFIQKLLEQSMRLENSRKLAIRIVGKLLGIIPVFCSRYLEKRLTSGKWNPAKKWRKARPCIKRRRRRKDSRDKENINKGVHMGNKNTK